ncbi:Metallo-dependent phosphatase [Aulographum hederae CBS 113979]|uniref:Metallo-dependent phosphatase n=1 Tax=Aulographum hederae CBS 113979 TaxID=1176131 RepID=A0A6G1GZY7_9PEZI|nr:Metallo-dependent phosphatase [Aulographum hederae CBS 113979]
MESFSDFICVLSSTGLRAAAYVFLRWPFPPLICALFALYLVSFWQSWRHLLPYEVEKEELELVEEVTVDRRGKEKREIVERDIIVGVVKRPKIVKTLLTGLPSPSRQLWTFLTFGINVALVLMTLDVVYTPLSYPSHDLAFTRVGYVSDRSASILVREPDLSKFPLYVRYREDSVPSDKSTRKPGFSWKYAGTIHSLPQAFDYTNTYTIDRLYPDTIYQYAVANHSAYFKTAPSPGAFPSGSDKFTFLTTSCIKPRVPYVPFSHPLSIQGFRYLADLLPTLQAQFMLFLGDFIYVDVPHRHGTTAESYRREYRQVYASPDWPSVSTNNPNSLTSLPWLHVIDDHEIANDWDKNTTGVYEAAMDPWMSYHGSVNPPAAFPGQTFYSFTQGPASFFMLDTRSYRSPEVPPEELDVVKTMLGDSQYEALLAWLREPVPIGVKWKIVASSIPFTKNWRFGDQDTWAGYLDEREIILEAMWEASARRGIGIVVISGDRHEFAATEFPPPPKGKWPPSAKVTEFSVSPLSMFYLPVRTYSQQDDEDVCIKYIPDGNSKFGAIEIQTPKNSDVSELRYKLFVDGKEAWTHTLLTPPRREENSRPWW